MNVLCLHDLQLEEALDDKDVAQNELSELKRKLFNQHFDHAKAMSYVSYINMARGVALMWVAGLVLFCARYNLLATFFTLLTKSLD